jgi:hypothetical protein
MFLTWEKICEFSRPIYPGLIARSSNLRNGMSLRPKEFGFTVEGVHCCQGFLTLFPLDPCCQVSDWHLNKSFPLLFKMDGPRDGSVVTH